jgi:hypothetical protein
MKISIEISEKDLVDIMRLTGVKKKGPAVVQFLQAGLQLSRRRELTEEVLAGRGVIDMPRWQPQATEVETTDPMLWRL